MTANMYNIIKKQNGERFAQTIRNFHSGIFDVPNIDRIVQYAGLDAKPILKYLVSLNNPKTIKQDVHQDPIELLDKAGYDAYIADTLEKQNAIEKYFAPTEKLCTFDDPDRFQKYYIINAVRKDINQIKREDFKKPQREDKYGTSVLSIQVLKTGGFISIKNRYNHTVENPDNTFNSNPDNIIIGLSDAIRHHFNVDFSGAWHHLPDGFVLIGNQICKFTKEINNVYIAPNFYIKDGKITPVNPDYQLMLGGGSVLDLKERKIENIANNNSIISLDEKLKQGKLNLIKNPDNSRTLHINKQPVCRVLDGEICWANVSGVGSVCLDNLGHLMGDLRFCDVQQMYICSCNLKNVSGITLRNIAKLNFFSNNYANGYLDFSGVQNLDLSVSNMLRNPNVVFNKNAKSIKISYVIGMIGELDLSSVETLNINHTNLSGISKIKLNPEGQIFMDEQSFNSAKNLIQQYKNIKIR